MTTSTNLDTIEGAIKRLSTTAREEQNRDVEIARETVLLPLIPKYEAELAALDVALAEHGETLTRAQRLLADPGLDTIENLRDRLRWARRWAAEAGEAGPMRDTLAKRIEAAKTFDLSYQPGLSRMQAARVLAKRLQEASGWPSVLADLTAKVTGALAEIAGRVGPMTVTPRATAPQRIAPATRVLRD